MPRGHVLIVDDEPDLVRGLAIRLGAAGYTVASAGDAVGAVAAVLRDRPDLVLLDLVLPSADGQTVLERLHGLAGVPVPPVVCLTARTDPETRRQALAAGAVAYLTKPFEARDVLAAVARHLAPARRDEGAAG